jgi:hypothetical protein
MFETMPVRLAGWLAGLFARRIGLALEQNPIRLSRILLISLYI